MNIDYKEAQIESYKALFVLFFVQLLYQKMRLYAKRH